MSEKNVSPVRNYGDDSIVVTGRDKRGQEWHISRRLYMLEPEGYGQQKNSDWVSVGSVATLDNHNSRPEKRGTVTAFGGYYSGHVAVRYNTRTGEFRLEYSSWTRHNPDEGNRVWWEKSEITPAAKKRIQGDITEMLADWFPAPTHEDMRVKILAQLESKVNYAIHQAFGEIREYIGKNGQNLEAHLIDSFNTLRETAYAKVASELDGTNVHAD